MVNTSININKTDNHLSSKTIELNKTKAYNAWVGNPRPSLGQA